MCGSLPRTFAAALALAAAGMFTSVIPGYAGEAVRYDLKIERQSLSRALQEFAKQSGVQIIFFSKVTDGYEAPDLNGSFTVSAALNRLLNGSELTYREINAKTIEVQLKAVGEQKDSKFTRTGAEASLLRLSQAEAGEDGRAGEGQGSENDDSATVATTGKKQEEQDSEGEGIPEILVRGSKIKSLNTDIRRTENDAQPYIVLGREDIERSGAINLEEFFKSELTASASIATAGQNQVAGNRSQINLRGLGTDETLILIDGRRTASFNFDGTPQQPDINGVPLAAVERIEVLPTTASGIYGGGATGGVINIVLRRDYSGIESRLTYGNTFNSDVASRRVDLSTGFGLGSRTTVLLAGSYSDSNPLLAEERDFIQRGRQLIRHNGGGDPQALNQFSGRYPPLGATTNIRSSTGADLVLDDGTPLNSPITFVPVGYAGPLTDGGEALVANAGQFNVDLAPTAQAGGGRGYALLSAPEVKTFMATLRQELTPKIQAFLELQTSDSATQLSMNAFNLIGFIPASALSNPFQQSIRVAVPAVGLDGALTSEAEDVRVVAGMTTVLPGQWQAGLDFTWGRARSAFIIPPVALSPDASAAFNAGSVDVLRDVSLFPFALETLPPNSQAPNDMTLGSAVLRSAGLLPWKLPGGSLELSSLIEHRQEKLGGTIGIDFLGTPYSRPERSQSVSSVYIEARLPFVSERNRRLGMEILDLQIAVRRDDYRTDVYSTHTSERVANGNRNSSVDPTLAIRYRPSEDITLRGSYGTGYLPPSLSQLLYNAASPSNFLSTYTDPLRDNELIQVVEFRQGGNAGLRPEESESWSFGLILTPRPVRRLRISADWSQILKKDNIGLPVRGVLDQAAFERFLVLHPERVSRGLPSDGFPVGPITGVDFSLVNIARSEVEAIDLAVDYEAEIGRAGTLDFRAKATHLVNLKTQDLPGAPVVENAGLVNSGLIFGDSAGGLKWNAHAQIDWAYGNWSLGWRTRFFDSYYLDPSHAVNLKQGAATIPSQIYHDIFGGFHFDQKAGSDLDILAGLEVRFGVTNVLNRRPPPDVVNNSTGLYSLVGDPRTASYYLSVRKSFWK